MDNTENKMSINMTNIDEILNNNKLSIIYLAKHMQIPNTHIKLYPLTDIYNLINLTEITYQITYRVFDNAVKEYNNIEPDVLDKILLMIKETIIVVKELNKFLMSYVSQRPLPDFFRIYRVFSEHIDSLNKLVLEAFYDDTKDYTLIYFENKMKIIIDEINSITRKA